MGIYAVFGLFALLVLFVLAEGSVSCVLTLAGMCQCLAFVFLAVQVSTSKSTHGISSKMLKLDLLALCCRLSSTLHLNGYLPVDYSGDWACQACDVASVGLILYLLLCFTGQKNWSDSDAQTDKDAMPVAPLLLISFVLAALFYADLDKWPIFDFLWMAGLNLSVVSVLPQLWLVSANDCRIDAITGHSIAALAVGRILSGYFMWIARSQFKGKPWIGSFNHTPYFVLGVHAVHLILVADFGYHYARAILKGKVKGEMVFDELV